MSMSSSTVDQTSESAPAGMKISRLVPAQIEQAAGMLVEAFKDEEAATYHLDTRKPSTLWRMQLVYTILLRLFLEAGRPVVTALQDEEVVGALILTDPRIRLTRKRVAAALLPNLPHILPHVASQPINSLRIMAATQHPAGLTKPYFTGEMLGVGPDHQGRGVGSALLSAIQAIAKGDAAISGIYMNTASGANRAFYEKRGFDTLKTEDLPRLEVYHMFWQNPAFG